MSATACNRLWRIPQRRWQMAPSTRPLLPPVRSPRPTSLMNQVCRARPGHPLAWTVATTLHSRLCRHPPSRFRCCRAHGHGICESLAHDRDGHECLGGSEQCPRLTIHLFTISDICAPRPGPSDGYSHGAIYVSHGRIGGIRGSKEVLSQCPTLFWCQQSHEHRSHRLDGNVLSDVVGDNRLGHRREPWQQSETPS